MHEEDRQRDLEMLLRTISIPALDIEQPILQGIKLKTFHLGLSHWPGTVMPDKVGIVVLGTVRTSGSRPFRYFDQVAKGDEVIVATDDGSYVYFVKDKEVANGCFSTNERL